MEIVRICFPFRLRGLPQAGHCRIVRQMVIDLMGDHGLLYTAQQVFGFREREAEIFSSQRATFL